MSTQLYPSRKEFTDWAKQHTTDQEYNDLLEAWYVLMQIFNAAATAGDCELGWTATPQFAGVKWKSPELANQYLDRDWPADKMHLKTLHSKFYQKFIRRTV